MLSKKEKVISLIGNGVFSIPLSEDFPKEFSPEEAEELFRVAKNHDLAHVVASSLKKNSIVLPTDWESKFQKQLFMAVYRCEKLQYELKRLSELFEKEEILFIPLKGSVLRPYYPETWMRTSSDIDILVRIEDLDAATKVVTEQANYGSKGQWTGERSFFSPDGIHLELHFFDEADKEEGEIFRVIWDHVVPVEGCKARMQTEWEFFYAHHVMHMAKHFSHGGCGIRPFVDLALMREKLSLDLKKKQEYLESFGLVAFSDAAEHLSSVWFEKKKHTALSEQMQDYLLEAGIFGSVANQVALEKSGKSKLLNGFFAHIWLPYDHIKHQYPVLLRYKWLLPFCQIRRWFRLLFKGGLKRSVQHVRENRNVSDEKVKRVANLMDQLKLN
ncbi:MAG: hypothetical protein E7580_05515 [Ruminococcaceae bacterium]|nr:hypothetical protein [Oscillospiraceae bacterium]